MVQVSLSLFVLTVAISAGLKHWPLEEKAEMASSEDGYSSTASAQPVFRFVDLLELIKTTRSETIGALLPKLPAEFLQNYTLMKKSASIQNGSPAFPRALLFGETGNLILSFNGHPKQAGYGAIETSEFDETTKRIYFREIIFKTDEANQEVKFENNELAPEEILLENSKFLITKENPMKCMMCHSDRPHEQEKEIAKNGKDRLAKYLWSPYSTWLGAYGEERDYEDVEGDFKKFKEDSKNLKSRYHSLYSPENLPTFPYFSNETAAYSSKALQPNNRMNHLMGIHYSAQTVKLITEHPLYPFVKDDLIRLSLHCDMKDSKAELEKDIAQFLKKSKDIQSVQDVSSRLAEQKEEIEADSNDKDVSELHAWREVLAAMGWRRGILSFRPNLSKLNYPSYEEHVLRLSYKMGMFPMFKGNGKNFYAYKNIGHMTLGVFVGQQLSLQDSRVSEVFLPLYNEGLSAGYTDDYLDVYRRVNPRTMSVFSRWATDYIKNSGSVWGPTSDRLCEALKPGFWH